MKRTSCVVVDNRIQLTDCTIRRSIGDSHNYDSVNGTSKSNFTFNFLLVQCHESLHRKASTCDIPETGTIVGIMDTRYQVVGLGSSRS